MKIARQTLLFLIAVLPSMVVAGSRSDSTDSVPHTKPVHRNVIKFNPTPMLLWGDVKNLTFSYERVIGRSQSVSLMAGYLVYPKLIGDSLAGLIALTDRQKRGINLAAEYRFYPLRRNRRPTPDGLYLGPYVSYYGNRFENKFDILHTSVDQSGSYTVNINIINVGFELGYQFIFWKRLSVDLLMFGPSISYYTANLRVDGNLDPDQISEVNQEFVQKLLDRFPALGYILSGEKVSKSGFRSSMGFGLRYAVQIGFHF